MQLNLYNLGAVVSDCDCYSEDPEFDHRLDRYLFKDNKFISGLGWDLSLYFVIGISNWPAKRGDYGSNPPVLKEA